MLVYMQSISILNLCAQIDLIMKINVLFVPPVRMISKCLNVYFLVIQIRFISQLVGYYTWHVSYCSPRWWDIYMQNYWKLWLLANE